ncbi:MAG: hypothetical protein AAGA48_15940 [Myxococcota bacterium]
MRHRMTVWIAVAILGLLLGLPKAHAADPFGWTQPSPKVQLAADKQPIPLGKGALFVPSMTDPLNEPALLLIGESNSEIREIGTGRRVMVDPGHYVVIATSGTPDQGVSQAVTVYDGQTTTVDVTWGAVRIEVVDNRRVPHRQGYEIIRADNRQPYGTGFGADTLQGEKLRTWFLPPGVYRIVRPGSNYRALRDFATVYVPPGGFVRYRLVLDRETGEFQGSGVILPDEFGSPKGPDSKWFRSLVLGAVGSWLQQRNVVGTSTASGSLFLDGQLAYNNENHSAAALLQIEEGASQIRPQEGQPLPVVKAQDRVRLDLLYTYFLRPRIGPYLRAAAESQAFRTSVLATEDTVVSREFADGRVARQFVPANETYFLAGAWEPTIVREGMGLNMRVINRRWLSLNWRIGVGLRQNRFGGSWVVSDDPNTDEVETFQVESFNQQGLESTIVANARVSGFLVYATDLELFTDFQTFSQPTTEWRNTVTLRLSRNLSINYILNVEWVPVVVERTRFEQSVLLRAAWAIL